MSTSKSMPGRVPAEHSVPGDQTPRSPSRAPGKGTTRFGRDLTAGSIPGHLMAVCLPMLLGNLINSGYSVINTIWLGQIVGERAVGATAASFPVVFIFIGLASAATLATTILVSQHYGAGRLDQVKRTVDTSFTLGLLLGGILTVAGILSADRLLLLMGTPKEVYPLASPYLQILMGSFVFMFLSFLTTSILRGIGDTRTPLLFMGGGVLLNAILDPLLILGAGPLPALGLNGAAVASLLSSAFALLLGIVYLNRRSHLVAFHPRRLRLDGQVVREIARLGFPSMVQQTLISLSGAFVTSFVNAFGSHAIAAFGAASRIDGIAFMPSMSIGMATSAMAGQNLGAGRSARVRELFRWGATISSGIALVFTLAELTFPRQLLSLFLNDPQVIEVGVDCLRVVCLSNLPFAILFVSNGIINGAGYTFVTMVFSLVSLWGVRVPVAALLSQTRIGLTGVWLAMVSSAVVLLVLSLSYYASGRWQKLRAPRSSQSLP